MIQKHNDNSHQNDDDDDDDELWCWTAAWSVAFDPCVPPFHGSFSFTFAIIDRSILASWGSRRSTDHLGPRTHQQSPFHWHCGSLRCGAWENVFFFSWKWKAHPLSKTQHRSIPQSLFRSNPTKKSRTIKRCRFDTPYSQISSCFITIITPIKVAAGNQPWFHLL